jgi:hypothetical protein
MAQAITEHNMSKKLIESIIDDNLVSAKDIFEERIEEILECKLYEEKRRLSAEMNEAAGGMSRKEFKEREDAGFVPAHYPKEKGGLGLSQYDIGQEEKKKRLAARAKAKKKVDEETIDEMRAPGEVPGSEERKADAQRLRSLRKGLSAVGADKRTLNKDYLSARRAQMGPKTTVSDTETPTQTKAEPAAAPQADTTPRQMPKLDKPKPPRDISVLAPKGKGLKALRKPDAPRNMDIISRYRSGLERAKDLQTRGSKGAVKRFKKAYGMKAMPAQAASGLSIIKKGFDAIASTAGE